MKEDKYCMAIRSLPYSVKGEGVLQVEGEGWSEERGVLHLSQHTHSEEDGRAGQMNGRARGLLPLQLNEEGVRGRPKGVTYFAIQPLSVPTSPRISRTHSSSSVGTAERSLYNENFQIFPA